MKYIQNVGMVISGQRGRNDYFSEKGLKASSTQPLTVFYDEQICVVTASVADTEFSLSEIYVPHRYTSS